MKGVFRHSHTICLTTCNPEVVLLIGPANHIIISPKGPKIDKKIFTHNAPIGICGFHNYIQSGVERKLCERCLLFLEK